MMSGTRLKKGNPSLMYELDLLAPLTLLQVIEILFLQPAKPQGAVSKLKEEEELEISDVSAGNGSDTTQ